MYLVVLRLVWVQLQGQAVIGLPDVRLHAGTLSQCKPLVGTAATAYLTGVPGHPQHLQMQAQHQQQRATLQAAGVPCLIQVLLARHRGWKCTGGGTG